jgi:hypothetical protein
MKVFSNADQSDNAGRSNLDTAKAFLASSYFFEWVKTEPSAMSSLSLTMRLST